MISIFNGRRRSLGNSGTETSVFAQIDVGMREYVHVFKGAKFAVFVTIALHSDEDGYAFPSIALLSKETGYTEETIVLTLGELRKTEINGFKVLARKRMKGPGNKYGNNVYLIFPTNEEWEEMENPKPTPKNPWTENPTTEKPSPENPGLEPTPENPGYKYNHGLEPEPCEEYNPSDYIYTHETRSRASRTADASSTTSHPLKAKPVNVIVPALAQEKKSVSDAVVAKNTGHGKGAYSLFPEFKGIKTPAQRERQSPGESIAEYKNMEPIHPSKNALRWYTQRFVQNFDCLPEVGNFPAAASRLKDLVTRHGAEVCEHALTRFFADEKQRVRGYGWNNFVTCFESYRFEKGAGGGNGKQTPMDKMYQAVDRINVIKNRGEL